MRKQTYASSSRFGKAMINERINATTVQLIGSDGTNHGEVAIEEAIKIAEDEGLDLVQVSAKDDVPICKIMDYGKYRFQVQRKASEARKKQKVTHVKEIKLRPNIDTHDYEVKMRAISRFIEKGDKVKVTLRFKGREVAHKDLGMNLLNRVKEQFEDKAKLEYGPKLDGRQIMMVLAPM